MKSLRFCLMTAFCACLGATMAQQPYSQRMVESLSIQNFNDNTRQSALSQASFGYVPGLVAKSVLSTYLLYPEKDLYWQEVKLYADRQLTGDPERPVRIGDNDIDAINAGKIFFDLYRISLSKGDTQSAERYKEAATYMRNKLKFNHTRIQAPLEGAGGFIHKGRYPNQMWLDGLYMGAAFLAGWEDCFGGANPDDWSDIALQFKTIHAKTWDAKKKLNYHAWSASPEDPNSFWANKTAPYKGCSAEFWARGCGWYFAALADVLEVMPQNHPDYKALLKIYKQVAKGLSLRQDKSGSWYQLLQYDDSQTADGIGDADATGRRHNVGTNPNYLEASASGMFTYAFAKGVRLGFLPRKAYLPIVKKAYQGLLDNFITENPDGSINIIQTCSSAGLGPANNPGRTGTINYYLCGGDTKITQNEGKAIGSFTLATCEYERLINSK